jgi:protein-S-isoprenylcysteine O-methyltransferase Ste14
MLISIGNFLFRFRNGLFPLCFALLLLPGPDMFVDPLQAAILGGLVAALGQLVRALTIGLDYIVRGGRQGKVYADGLVISGIYAHTRNPMYVGNITIAAGLALASNSWPTVIITIPLVCFVYIAIVAAEENFLRGKFGTAFDEYCRNVPRWLPRLGALWSTFSGATFHWRRVIVKEYGTPAGWIAAVCGVTLYNIWSIGAWDGRSAGVRAVYLVIGITFLLWLLARVLKKTKILRAD